MVSELPYEKVLQEFLKDELRVLNAHIPRQRKSLSDLLGEEYPYVVCSDGSTCLFKKKELEYLAEILDAEEQKALFLPMLIEIGHGQDEAMVISTEGIEEKVISKILKMPVSSKQGRVTIYKPQLSMLRKVLKTSTQYVFSTNVLT